MSRKLRFSFLLAVGLAFLTVIALGVGVEYGLPTLLVSPSRVAWDRHQRTPEDPAKYGLTFDPLDVRTEDGFLLKGWFVHATSDKPSGTVIVLHGHASCKEHMLVLARLLAPHGYNVILYDSRAQGESGGRYCTFGAKEKRHVSRYVDEAQKRFGALGPISLIGTSFGSAVAIQTLAEDKRFSCGIVVSPFRNLEETARNELKKIVHFDSPWLLKHALDKGSGQADFRASDINPEETARAVQCPVLVIHGEKDERFPVAWARGIYENLPSPEKEWYLARGNGHDDVFWYHDAMNVKRVMLLFLTKHTAREKAAP